MELQDYRQLGAEERDAGQDYPESNSEAPIVRLRTGSPDSTSRTGAGGEGKAARKRPREVFGVWERGTGLRHIASQAVRVRAAVGDRGVSALCDAPCVVRELWGKGGGCPWRIRSHAATGS